MLSEQSFYEITLVNVSLSNNCGKVFLSPVFGRHVLLKNHHLLETHLLEFLRIFENYRGKNEQTQSKVTVLGRNVGIVESKTDLHGELAQ